MKLSLATKNPIPHASTKAPSNPNELPSLPEDQRNTVKKVVSVQHAIENLENRKRGREIDCSSDSRPLKRHFLLEPPSELNPILNLPVFSRKSIPRKDQFYVGFNHENEGVYEGEISNWLPEGKGTFFSRGERRINEGKSEDGQLSQESAVALSFGSSKYTGSFSNGKYHGEGYSVSDGSIYKGQFSNGMRSGEGFVKLPDGSKYEGGFSNGKYHGTGTFTFANGIKFKGEFSNGLYHGKGTLLSKEGRVIRHGKWENGEVAEKIATLPDSPECEGLFFNGKYHREKVSLLSNDLKYNSLFLNEFSDGEETNFSKEEMVLREGIRENGEPFEGTAILSDGSKHKGQFLNRLAHGEGTLFSNEGEIIREGIWENGELSEGIAVFSDGSEYKGQFSNGKPHGKGVVKLPNGLVYDGQFSNGLYHGEGTIFKEGEPLFSGKWSNNQFYGKGTLTLSNGLKYSGELSAWKFHGSGTISTEEGEVLCKGEWKDGLYFEGIGFSFLPHQMIYKGQFSEGEFNGKGEIICSSEDKPTDHIIKDVRWQNQKLSVHRKDACFFSADYWRNEGQVKDRFLFSLNDEALVSLRYTESGMPSYRPSESKLISFCPSNPTLDRFENTDPFQISRTYFGTMG